MSGSRRSVPLGDIIERTVDDSYGVADQSAVSGRAAKLLKKLMCARDP